MYKKIGIGITVLLIIFLIVVIINMDKGIGNLKVNFFKAGKADAIFIYNNKFSVLIDTGESDLSDELISYIKDKNFDSIDYLIITHFDKDHVGSASEVVKRLDVKNAIHSNYPKDSEYYNKYIDALDKKNITPIVPTSDMSVKLDDIEMIINPPDKIYSNDPSNNSSLIVSLTYKNNKFLFMGDAKDDRIEDYLLTHNESFDVLKVPYHGRELNSLDHLVSVVKPKYSVITSGNKKQEAEETLTTLSKYTSKYYLTRMGSVLITSDGENINVEQ